MAQRVCFGSRKSRVRSPPPRPFFFVLCNPVLYGWIFLCLDFTQRTIGKTAAAIKEYRAAIAEGHAGSMTLLHLLLLRQGNEKMMDEAWKLLTQAIEKHDGLAQCLAGINCFDNPNFSPRFGMHLLMKGGGRQRRNIIFLLALHSNELCSRNRCYKIG